MTKKTLLALLLCMIVGVGHTFAKSAKKPNVIVVITDDQGYGDVGANGNKVIKTPHLDKLHDTGIYFTNFHAGTTCAPSRSGLMSGAEGNRSGVWHTIGGCNLLRTHFVTMPELFQESGYKTAMFGKWHLGDEEPYRPVDRGFDLSVWHGGGGVGQTPDFWDNDYFDDTYFCNETPKKYKGYCTDVYFNEALNFIKENKDEQFFVYLSTNAPHGPLNCPEEYYNIYKDETRITDAQKAFYGMITNIDDNMGAMETELKKLGLYENTIVVFLTDNGTAYGIAGKGDKQKGFNAGMKGHKGSHYEGGHRVPLFIKWPEGNLTGGVEIDHIAMNYDIMPTLASLCNLKQNADCHFDGVDFSPLLKKEIKKMPHRYTVVDNNRIQQPEKWRMSAVMDDEWRLIDGKKLFYLPKDKGQENDVAAKYPEKVKEMRAAYEKWWDYTSTEFSHFEAYEIGKVLNKEHTLTIHDAHTSDPLAWNQSYIRNPNYGRKPALGKGYFMIDIQEKGTYQVSLRRYPKESNLGFLDTPKQLGTKTKYYAAKPEGVALNVKKAILNVEGAHQEFDVDAKSNHCDFELRLSEGRQRLSADFVLEDGTTFGAFYVYVKRID